MTYRLKFIKSAFKEWQKLDPHAQNQFKACLKNRLEKPRVEPARLRGYPDLYKIKLRSMGYRLACLVKDEAICGYVICIGRRDKIYEIVPRRLEQ